MGNFLCARICGFSITQLPKYKLKRIHGKHDKANQRRTQESQTRRPKETQGGKAAQAPRLSTRIEKAQGQETGPRTGEAVRAGAELRSADSRGRLSPHVQALGI